MSLASWIHSTSSRSILIVSSFLLYLLLPLRFPDQNFASTSHLLNACWMSRQYHSPWADHSNNRHRVKSRNYGVFHCVILSILPTLWNNGKSAPFMVPRASCPSSPVLNRNLRKWSFLSSGTKRSIVSWKSVDVTEEHVASTFRVDE